MELLAAENLNPLQKLARAHITVFGVDIPAITPIVAGSLPIGVVFLVDWLAGASWEMRKRNMINILFMTPLNMLGGVMTETVVRGPWVTELRERLSAPPERPVLVKSTSTASPYYL